MSGGDPVAILFDLDGTLIATRRLYLEAFADALEPALGRRPGHDEMMGLRPRAEVRFLAEVGGTREHAGVMSRFYAAYARRHPADFQGIYPGVSELLQGLRERGHPLGLVTGKSRRAWEITRPHVEPELGTFQVMVFDDDVPAPKPDPAGLHMAVAALGCHAPASLYVGDSMSDLEAAHRAGLTPVGVLWSKRPQERGPFRELALELGGLAPGTPHDLLLALRGATPGSSSAPRRTSPA
jgi:HAD superfamily hydrolase (TIGR01509 family)